MDSTQINIALASESQQKAIQEAKAGNISAGIAHIKKSLEWNPLSAEAYYLLATFYTQLNQISLALNAYQDALHLAPDFILAHHQLGVLFLGQGKQDAAKIQFNNVITLNPNHLQGLFYLGGIALQEKKLNEAESYFKAVLNQNKEHVDALNNLGIIALQSNQKQDAIQYFTQALAYQNDHVEARHNLASTFMHYDRFENALTHYHSLNEQTPEVVEIRYNMGVAEMALGQLQKAIQHFDFVLFKEQQNFAAISNLAVIYLRLEDKAKAHDYLLKAKSLKPDDEATTHLLNALDNEQTEARRSPMYVKHLFDNYASRYDTHLTTHLKYHLPELIAHHLKAQSFHHVLDLGCGTGLLGEKIRPYCQQLTGVDLSSKMTALAHQKSIYDTLFTGDIFDFFKQNNTLFDLITAADVLPYFAELDDLFTALKHHLAPGGLAILTTEISEQRDFTLEPTARFSHHPRYIQTCCAQSALSIIGSKKVIGRVQDNQPVEMMLYEIGG